MKKILLVVLTLILALGAFTACASKTEAPVSEALAGKVVIAGSTSVQPLSEELANAFMAINPGVTVEVQGGGSGVGIKAAQDKIADFGASSRELNTEEQAAIVNQYLIAKDGVAIVLDPANTVSDLTLDQIKMIFTGKITNWKEVGGADAKIVVVSREAGSGTRGAFIEITKVSEKDASGTAIDNTTQDAIIQPSTGAVKQTVGGTPNSIGYMSIGAIDNTIKAIKVEGVDATEANVVTGDYGISRPFIYLSNTELTDVAQAYLDFVLSAEGQAIVAEDFIPVQ
jgi:phosphate transport system substrate-binding protein